MKEASSGHFCDTSPLRGRTLCSQEPRSPSTAGKQRAALLTAHSRRVRNSAARHRRAMRPCAQAPMRRRARVAVYKPRAGRHSVRRVLAQRARARVHVAVSWGWPSSSSSSRCSGMRWTRSLRWVWARPVSTTSTSTAFPCAAIRARKASKCSPRWRRTGRRALMSCTLAASRGHSRQGRSMRSSTRNLSWNGPGTTATWAAFPTARARSRRSAATATASRATSPTMKPCLKVLLPVSVMQSTSTPWTQWSPLKWMARA